MSLEQIRTKIDAAFEREKVRLLREGQHLPMRGREVDPSDSTIEFERYEYRSPNGNGNILVMRVKDGEDVYQKIEATGPEKHQAYDWKLIYSPRLKIVDFK